MISFFARYAFKVCETIITDANLRLIFLGPF